jgi:flagellar protein FlbD
MIKLTQLNGQMLVINVDVIQLVEEVPHTVITTITNKKIVVKETADEIIQKSISYKAQSFAVSKERT